METNEMTSKSTSPVIEARGLTKAFGNNLALRGIDISVNKGERLVVFGPNGAGKTTLVKILSTLVKPSSGNVLLNGIDIRSNPAQVRRIIALVSHQTFLYDDLTIYENLKFYGKMYDVLDLDKRIGEVISWAQLESRRHDRTGTLSRGMQQRASIARAILHSPSILLLDEPETGLDPDASAMIADIINGKGNDSRTVVMTSHNLERGLELSDRVIILDRGKIVYQADKKDLDTEDFRQVYDSFTGVKR
ncbi:ABC transporter ATP-binding protein [Chloroflexota bacterium]